MDQSDLLPCSLPPDCETTLRYCVLAAFSRILLFLLLLLLLIIIIVIIYLFIICFSIHHLTRLADMIIPFSADTLRHDYFDYLTVYPNCFNNTYSNFQADFFNIFGECVVAALVVPKQCAFIQFNSVENARFLLECLPRKQIIIKGSLITLNYSVRREVVPNPRYSESRSSSFSEDVPFVDNKNTALAPTSVVLVGFVKPIPIELIYHIFIGFGEILRIVTFDKRQLFQALVKQQLRITSITCIT